jgi:hypothetical protein
MCCKLGGFSKIYGNWSSDHGYGIITALYARYSSSNYRDLDAQVRNPMKSHNSKRDVKRNRYKLNPL